MIEISTLHSMDIGRKKLPHTPPYDIIPNPEGEVFFITVCCQPRGLNQLALPHIWEAMRETITHRQINNDCYITLFLAMPDHWHALISFPSGAHMEQTIKSMKSWLAKSQGIVWQNGFFDHRLRNRESAEEKRLYILNNPYRANLIQEGQKWPYMIDVREGQV